MSSIKSNHKRTSHRNNNKKLKIKCPNCDTRLTEGSHTVYCTQCAYVKRR